MWIAHEPFSKKYIIFSEKPILGEDGIFRIRNYTEKTYLGFIDLPKDAEKFFDIKLGECKEINKDENINEDKNLNCSY